MTQPTDPVIPPEDPARPPLGMPPGSVRAIIVLYIVGTVFGRIALGLGVPDIAMNVALGAAGLYGVMRVNGK